MSEQQQQQPQPSQQQQQHPPSSARQHQQPQQQSSQGQQQQAHPQQQQQQQHVPQQNQQQHQPPQSSQPQVRLAVQQTQPQTSMHSVSNMGTSLPVTSMTNTMATMVAAGIRNPIPQVQVIPQMHSPPYISQFPYNQQQIMLQNAAMQAAMQASAMNMNINPQQLNMNMNMAAMAMQRQPQSVNNSLNSPGNLLSHSPTTPTQQNPGMNFSSAVTSQVSNSNAQSSNGKGGANGNKGQTTGMGQIQQAQATALVGGKPIMPTQGMQAGGPQPLVLSQLSVLPNPQVANTQGFVTGHSKCQSMSLSQTGQSQLINTQAPIRFSQPQIVSSTGQIISSHVQPMLANQAVLQAMASLQQQGIPLAHQQLLSAPGQSPTILSAGQSLFLRPASQIPTQQGMMTATGVQTIGPAMKGGRMEMPQNLQVKANPGSVALSKQAAGAQSAGKAILPSLGKINTAKIPPTQMVGQRTKLSIPSLPRTPKGRPRNQNKSTAVTTATAATNTVASALKATAAATSQSKPETPTTQVVNLTTQAKSQSDSEIEAAKKTTTHESSSNGMAEVNQTETGSKDPPTSDPNLVNSTTDLSEDKMDTNEKVEIVAVAPIVVEKQRAIVKPHILTHVIEGFIIQEGPEPFAVERSSLLTEFIPPKPGQTPSEDKQIDLDGDSHMDSGHSSLTNKQGLDNTRRPFVKCEFCGKDEQSSRFKKSNRFCSMPCAKRFNVACSRRISLFRVRGRPPSLASSGKVMKKKPVFGVRKGWRGGRGSRYNLSGEMDLDDNSQFDHAEQSSSPSSENESSMTPDSPTTVQGQGDGDYQDTPQSNPARWNVIEVYEFIKSMPGCAPYAEEFRSQEIDGQALMLLKEDHLMTAMSMKLGPALKICARINTLRDEAV
ncbi:polyhomeotic-like protein 1 isoform X2 [Mizuhopecten yessoensis]|uniref:polyhomeotic-like protein 1 isoform X2 n=1 Tax=Mizuhopecten yessoensis TaxID=6573 RepID=UPI000B45CABD|nr:polyhomeotic-like protein 1 isoform X2 [Mizuhopecten yessoensis]